MPRPATTRSNLDLAGRAAKRAGVALRSRVEEFAALEAELITSPDPVFRFHSGPPPGEGC